MSDAEQRVRQYLDWQDDGDLIASSYDENEGGRHLTVADVRTVLRQLDEARKHWETWNNRAMELAAERDEVKQLNRTLTDTITNLMGQSIRERRNAQQQLDEARQFARRFRDMAFKGFENGRSVFRQLGLDKLPDWLTADQPAAGPHHTDTTTSEGN